jgi:hypothetical protein
LNTFLPKWKGSPQSKYTPMLAVPAEGSTLGPPTLLKAQLVGLASKVMALATLKFTVTLTRPLSYWFTADKFRVEVGQ